jgi:hypothetical protein
MKNRIYTLILLAAGMLFGSFDGLATAYHVKTTGSDTNNGTSWATAFLTLQKALDVAVSGDQIWVAAGTYLPTKEFTTGEPRTKTFVMKNGVAIYGGFPNTGNPGLAQRDWVANVTTLSGDIGTPGDDSDNSYHVIYNYNNGVDASATLDGFTITGGNAVNGLGGGAYNYLATPTYANCTFIGNQAILGAGMSIEFPEAEMLVKNCIFKNNTARDGGGLYHASPYALLKVVNCVFQDNSATNDGGGLAKAGGQTMEVTNCTFTGNTAGNDGGAIHNYAGDLTVTNCIMWGNGSEIENSGILEPIVTYSIVQGGYPGTGNLNTDPLFMYPPGGDLRPKACSPAIDAGNDAANSTTTDLDGNPRKFDAIAGGSQIDMGAYEVNVNICLCYNSITRLYVDADSPAGNSGNGKSWIFAFTDLQKALDIANTCGITEIWVAAGIYLPTKESNMGEPRSKTFSMVPGVKIYGGFAGGETNLNQRNWTANVTTLSGDIGTPNDVSDNCYHVILNNGNGLDATAVLDGFTVTGGNANVGSDFDRSGGGMSNNYSSPSVSNCVFKGNTVNRFGGGMSNSNSSPTLTNCIFSGNVSASSGGGLANAFNASPTVTNCTFTTNSSVLGRGVYNFSSSSPVITNCIFWNGGNEIFNNINATPTITYSIIQGGYTGTGNLDADPLFISSTNLRLQACSPAIDAGDNTAIPAGVTTDLDGNPRIYNSGTVDMGAYESSLSLCDCYASTTRLYVKTGSTGNGKTWGTAFAGLQDALDVAEACPGITEIWVSAGTYLPTKESGGTGDRFKTFVMLPGVKIYGGFAGGETNLSQRDWVNNVTTLSGDIGTPNDDSDNSYHVIFNNNNGLGATAVLDGFTVTGGKANGFYDKRGGGMFNEAASPSINNCIFSVNAADKGGGMYILNASPDVTNCFFTTNSAGTVGGGVFNDGSTGNFSNCTFDNNTSRWGAGISNEHSSQPTITNCNFSNNVATLEGGGMQDAFSTSSIVTNCTFTNNVAETNGGGALIKYNSFSTFSNCTFSGNSANEGGGLRTVDSSPSLSNCIFWGNGTEIVSSSVTVNHSIVQGGYPGTGNLDADPLFVDVANGDLSLMKCSPAIDAGSNAAIPMGITTDLDGNARILNATGIPTATVDMGAYEYTGSRTITAVCASPTVQLDAGGNGSLTEAEVDMGSSADCSPLDLAIDMTSFTCADVGQNSVELTVTVPGLVGGGKCTASVTVEDNVLPTANCQPHTVQLDATGNASISADDVDNGSSDACGISSLSVSPNTFNCVNVYTTNTVTLTVTDSNGNVSTCNAVVTVEDNENPQPTCKTTTVQLGTSGQYALTENDVFAGGTDNCTVVNYWKITPSTVSCAAAGTTVPVLVEVFDASGNQASCTANIFVADNEAPVAICPANLPTVVLDQNGLGTLPANIGDGSSTDNCSATETSPAINFQCNAGPHSVTLTVTDGFNTVTTNCSFNVVDNQAPVAHCPANIPNVQLDENGNGSLPANIGDGSSTDNCTVLETSPELDFTCSDVGVQTVVLTASDGTNSSTANCSFNVVDNIAPAANCVSQTIQVSLNANAQYTLDPNQLDDNSTDACGIQSLSASPSILGCQHEGATTVTLTVTDQNGNTATCTANVEVAEFLTINNVSATAESCAGMGDGSITILATAGGGQLKYSIDGGASFQTSNTFGNLVPGVYNLVVKVFGVPSVCEKTATATVAVGSSLTTWYKDMDGDGYTDGVTQTGCQQPAGFVATAEPGDCNDNDPLEHPGQIWYEDLDGDGYGSGVWSVACQRPTGCFVASELVVVDTDCDDMNAAVSPVATEICDGLDNDCDGETDEGLVGTYVGNVLFTTQAQLDAWLSCYDVIQGSVTIQGGNITDLSPLSNITEITGNLMILMNGALTSLDGLENLSTVGGALFMYYNFQLSDCCALYNLLNTGGVGSSVLIFFNKVGCNSQAEILNNCNTQPLISNTNATSFGQANDAQQVAGINKTHFSVFPNPASHFATVKLEGAVKAGYMTIVDVHGKKIINYSIEENMRSIPIDLDGWRDGTYFIFVGTKGGEVQTQRMVVIGNNQ